jgi:hypothetical protein
MDTTLNPHDMEEEKKVSPPPTAAPQTTDDPLNDLQALRTTIERLQRDLRDARGREEERDRREQARLRDLRRSTKYIPSLTTPAPDRVVTSLTDPFVSRLRPSLGGQRSRRSLDAALRAVDDLNARQSDNDSDDDNANQQEEDTNERFRPRAQGAGQAPNESSMALMVAQRQAIINKALTKIPSPGRFSGKDEKDKDNCENWCKQMTNYLNGLFRGITDAHAERMQIVLGLLDQPASDWMNGVYREEENMSWEQLQPAFLEYIQGGRDRRALWKEKMEALAYGRGKCKDLLQFDHEFETLRIKLYPSSSANPYMNQRSADDYGAAIRRGDPRLYIECIRLLGRDFENATLSDWKQVAQQAVAVRNLTREVRGVPETGVRSGYSYRPSQLPTQVERTSVQNMRTLDGDAAEQDDIWTQPEAEEESPTAIQAVNTGRQARSATNAPENKRGVQLSEEIRKQLMAKGVCFNCYKRGHRARDINDCPNKGKRATRPPTKEELNA